MARIPTENRDLELVEILDAQGAAKRLGCTKKQFAKLVETGQLSPRVGKLYSSLDIDQFVDARSGAVAS